MSRRPTFFVDADDVICVSKPYGFYDVLAVGPKPEDLFEKLFDPLAAGTLLQLISEHSPRIVLTTSWLRFLDRDGFEQLFQATGLGVVTTALHEHWDAPQNRGQTRFDAIDSWLKAHHAGEPFVILDDPLSGTGLGGSRLRTCVAWCEIGVGLGPGHLEVVRSILATSPPEKHRGRRPRQATTGGDIAMQRHMLNTPMRSSAAVVEYVDSNLGIAEAREDSGQRVSITWNTEGIELRTLTVCTRLRVFLTALNFVERAEVV